MKHSAGSPERELELLRQEINRIKKGLATILIVLASVVIFSGAGSVAGKGGGSETDSVEFQTIRAKKLLLVDDSGRVVRHLQVENGVPVDVFLDAKGNPRVALSAQEQGAGIIVFSPDSNNIGSLMTGPNPSGQIVTMLGVMDRSSGAGWMVRQAPELGLLEAMKDESETIRMAAHVDADGNFKFHVQKSELENVGELIKWAGTIRSLVK